jgi:hypothetical protein
VRNRFLAVAAALGSILMMGFSEQEATQALNGEWQGKATPISLSVDTKTLSATYVSSGVKVSGPFVFTGSTARSVEFTIGTKGFVAHLLSAKELELAEAGRHMSYTLARVR